MARGKDFSVALLPIHPEYALRILSREKRVEFRRARFSIQPRFVVIYATHPMKQVVGAFEVVRIEEDTPQRLWARYAGCAGVSAKDYRQYFEGRDKGFAIQIGCVWQLRIAVPLSEIASVRGVPQSFQYLEVSELQLLLAMGLSAGSGPPPNPALQQPGRSAARS
jgi:predicted transcriptional regulator